MTELEVAITNEVNAKTKDILKAIKEEVIKMFDRQIENIGKEEEFKYEVGQRIVYVYSGNTHCDKIVSRQYDKLGRAYYTVLVRTITGDDDFIDVYDADIVRSARAENKPKDSDNNDK